MLLPIVLMAGCGIWVINEALEIFSSGLADIIGTTGSFANALLCVGMWVFWRGANLLGRAGVLLCSAGMALLTYRTAAMAFSGLRSDAEVVASPIFLLGAVAIALGVILIGSWIMRGRSAFPRWIGGAMVACTLLSLVMAFLHISPLIQSGLNIVLAVILAEAAVLALGRKSAM